MGLIHGARRSKTCGRNENKKVATSLFGLICDGLGAPSSFHTAPKLGASFSCPHCLLLPCSSWFSRIWQITAYMKLLLASIATGQLRHCVSTQQRSLFRRPRFLELGGSNTLRAARQKVGRAQPPLAPPPPPPGSRATGTMCDFHAHAPKLLARLKFCTTRLAMV